MKLRNVNDNDHDFLIELHNDPIVLHNLTNPTKISYEDHMRWWNSIKDDKSQLRFIFEDNNQRIGFAKIYNIDNNNKNCVLGADIHKDYRGIGYSKHLWRMLIDYCFETLLMHRVSLTTAEYNHIAQKVYKKLGFVEEGKLKESLFRDGKFHDQICMYLLSKDWYGTFRTNI